MSTEDIKNLSGGVNAKGHCKEKGIIQRSARSQLGNPKL